MMNRHDPDNRPDQDADGYSRAMDLYHRGLYAQAAEELEDLGEGSDVLGNVSGFYGAMSHRALGIEAMGEGRFEAAEKHLLAAINRIGNKADLAGYLASLYAQTERCDKCITVMERAEQAGDGQVDYYRKLAQAQWRAGKHTEAHMTLTEALRKIGSDSELYLQIGMFHGAQEQYEQAHKAINEAIAVDCTNSQAHYHMGLIEAAQGKVQSALSAFQRAFELCPDDLMLAYHLALAGRAARQQGYNVILRFADHSQVCGDSQISQLAHYITQETTFVATFLALPKSSIDKDLFGMLAGVLQMALAEHPEYADLNYYCSSIFNRLGRLDIATDYAQRAVEINPSYVQGLIHIGKLCLESGREDQAVEYLQRAVDCGGDWPDIHCMIAEGQLRTSRSNQAKEHLVRALQLNPNYTRATRELAAIAA